MVSEVDMLRSEMNELKDMVAQLVMNQSNNNKSFIGEGISFLTSGFTKCISPILSTLSSTTWREKVVVAGLLSYGAYKCFNKVKSWRAKPITVVESVDLYKGNVMESRRDGSIEKNLSRPRFQFTVGTFDGNKYVVHGNGIRLDNWLIMPDHVYSSAPEAFVKVSGKSGYLDLKTLELPYRMVDTDVLVLDCNEHESILSMMGLTKPVIQHEVPENGMYVSIVGPLGKGTTGNLRWQPNSFGVVEYDGTTLSGYSGAAYTKGDKLVGMHSFGGRVNGGFSISYLYATIKYEMGILDEDTAEFLISQFRMGNRIIEDKNFHSLDETRVSIKGRVHIMQRKNMYKAFGKDYNSSVEQRSFKREYQDRDPDRQDEADFRLVASTVPLPTSTVSNSSVVSEKSVTKAQQKLMSQLLNLSPQKHNRLRSLLNALDAPVPTAGPSSQQ